MNKKRASQKGIRFRTVPLIIVFLLLLVAGVFIGLAIGKGKLKTPLTVASIYDSYASTSTIERLDKLNSVTIPEWIDPQIIPVDGVSRDGILLAGFNDIVIHYIGNPGTSAQANHDFFCNPESEVSSHFIVGLDGEIIQCVPLNETSAASNWRNRDTISIEVCHPDDSGQFNEATYDSLVKLTAWLMSSGELDINHVIRHYDVTGKLCPIYYVENQDAWEQFKNDVLTYQKKNPTP